MTVRIGDGISGSPCNVAPSGDFVDSVRIGSIPSHSIAMCAFR